MRCSAMQAATNQTIISGRQLQGDLCRSSKGQPANGQSSHLTCMIPLLERFQCSPCSCLTGGAASSCKFPWHCPMKVHSSWHCPIIFPEATAGHISAVVALPVSHLQIAEQRPAGTGAKLQTRHRCALPPARPIHRPDADLQAKASPAFQRLQALLAGQLSLQPSMSILLTCNRGFGASEQSALTCTTSRARQQPSECPS